MPMHTELLPESIPPDPMPILVHWMAEAWEQRRQPNPDAMVLATADGAQDLSARVVLCKRIEARPGYLVFYSNYLSRKGRALARNPRAAAVIHWDHLHRQVRVEGPVVQVTAADSDAYFASRPWQSRLGAWASVQSAPVASREEMKIAFLRMAEQFGTPPPNREPVDGDLEIKVPRPPHWGGYQLWVQSIELWVEGAARIHDRVRWSRRLDPGTATAMAYHPGPWTATRLQP